MQCYKRCWKMRLQCRTAIWVNKQGSASQSATCPTEVKRKYIQIWEFICFRMMVAASMTALLARMSRCFSEIQSISRSTWLRKIFHIALESKGRKYSAEVVWILFHFLGGRRTKKYLRRPRETRMTVYDIDR